MESIQTPEVMAISEPTVVAPAVAPPVVPPTPPVVLALVASTVDVAIARVEKIHKPTPADKLQGVLESLKALNLDHKIIKVSKTHQVIFKDNTASKKPFYSITIELDY
jgi:hypothetical protein